MLKETLARDLKDAMRQKDKIRLAAIRMLQAAVTEKEKAGTGPLSSQVSTTARQLDSVCSLGIVVLSYVKGGVMLIMFAASF